MLSIKPVTQNINFGRALTPPELVEYNKTVGEARKTIKSTGNSILIVHDACLPQSSDINTGVGNLSSQKSSQFFDFVKSYLGINAVEVLPQGQVHPRNNFYCAYDGTALSLGSNQINLELLTTSKFDNILTKEEFQEVVKSNIAPDKETMANYENVVDNNSPHDMALRKAFDRFKTVESPVKKQFEDYVAKNNDWLEPKSIYEVLSGKHKAYGFEQWTDETDKNLYNPDFDLTQRQNRLKEILENKENIPEMEFYKFKQFMADEHLKVGRENLNKKGMKLFGDCPIGFSKDEVWSNPKAFLKDASIGWGLPALNYDTILQADSDSAKMLKRKVELFAQRYDGIRFDVAWAYITPKISYFDNRVERPNFKDSILTFIEKTVKEVKGEKFNSNDLIHEFEADPADFQPFHGSTPRPELKNRVSAYSTRYMKSDWGSNDVFLRRGWTPDELLVGVGNHDPLPLRQLAELSDPLGHENLNELKLDKNPQIGELARILSLDEDTLRQNPIEFIKAKFAEPMMAKNNMVFYMDVFGKKERFNSQSHNNRDNFRHKIADSFETDYHKAVQSGFGFNLMDSYEKIFKAQNLDMDHKTLYGQIVKFRDILLEVGSGIKTPEVKNRSAKSVWIVGGIIAAAGSIAALYPKKLKQEQAVVVAPVSNLNYQHNVDKAKFLK